MYFETSQQHQQTLKMCRIPSTPVVICVISTSAIYRTSVAQKLEMASVDSVSAISRCVSNVESSRNDVVVGGASCSLSRSCPGSQRCVALNDGPVLRMHRFWMGEASSSQPSVCNNDPRHESLCKGLQRLALEFARRNCGRHLPCLSGCLVFARS